MRTIVISKISDYFEVDDPSKSGSPPVGRGSTMKKALGDWLINNQKDLDLFIDVDQSARKDELKRREKELAKR